MRLNYLIMPEKLLSLPEALADTGKMIIESISGSLGGLTTEQRLYYRNNPVEFARDILGSDPYDKQEVILQSVADNERTTVRSAHGMGKSWGASEIVLWFSSCFIPSTVVTTAPTARQVKDILWREINTNYAQSNTKLGGRMLTLNWELSREIKWFATGFTTEEHDLDRFQGFHNTNILVVVDESCGVPANIFSSIEGLLSAGETVRLLLIGNPTNENTDFGKSFKSQFYNKFHLSVFDNPNFTKFNITIEDIRNNTWESKIDGPMPRPYLTTPQWVYQRYVTWGELHPLFQVRALGNFPTEDVDAFIPLNWIEKSYELDVQPSGNKILGIDIAGLGRDASVATLRHGDVQVFIKSWSKMNPMQSAGIIVNLIKEWTPDMVNIDSIGEGSGVVARLKELGYKVNGVNVGSKPDKTEEFLNLRAEIYWGIRTALRDGKLKLLKDDIQEVELLGTKAEPPTSKGLLKLVAKDKIKAAIGKSPDKADALSLTFYTFRQSVGVVSEDLSSVFEGSNNNQDDGILPDIPPIDKVYRNPEIDYNRIVGVCPNCNISQGVTLVGEAVDAIQNYKCLICQNKWEEEVI